MPASVVFTAGRGFCLSIGVSEIEKMKKRQSHQISAKVLILNVPPMSDVHTKNQRPSSKNGLGRACLRRGFYCRVCASGTPWDPFYQP